MLTGPKLVRCAIGLSFAAFLIAAYKLFVIAEFDGAAALLISLAYSTTAFAIWRVQFAITRPSGGMISYLPVLAVALRVGDGADVLRDLVAALVGELVLVLLVAMLVTGKPEAQS